MIGVGLLVLVAVLLLGALLWDRRQKRLTGRVPRITGRPRGLSRSPLVNYLGRRWVAPPARLDRPYADDQTYPNRPPSGDDGPQWSP